ncbi:hypothetical protein ABZR00_32225 [Pseudomonas aeruginosa]
MLIDHCSSGLLTQAQYWKWSVMEGPIDDDSLLEHIIQVSEDGGRVWVHSPTDGSLIGRFSKRFGIDVHRTVTDQMAGKGQCLYCTHEAAGEKEWADFRREILANFNIDVPKDCITFD